MPREFNPQNDEDKLIYDEEEEVIEMYFITEGIIGIGFSQLGNGFLNKKYTIAKKLKGGDKNQTIICDHYVVNNAKSQFIYMAMGTEEVRGYALSKKHFITNIFPNYPEITLKIQTESLRIYKKQIFKPINEIRKTDLATLNKKQSYTELNLMDIKHDSKSKNHAGYHKMQAEKMEGKAIEKEMKEMEDELQDLTDKIKGFTTECNQHI